VTAASAIDWASHLARAREVVAAALPPTPLVPSPGLGGGVLLKLESFQPTGSFKVRGAVAALTGAGGETEVVTASSGNHALGVAWAAQRLGISATVVVPSSTSSAKLVSLRRFEATVIMHGESYEHAERHARSLATGGMRYLSATSDPDVIAGQSTIGAELLAQIGGSFTVLCGIGGGALASGLGMAGTRSGRMSVIGVEAAASRAMSAAIKAGQVVSVHVGETLADGLAGNLEPDVITVNLIGEHVRHLVAVSEEQIAEAIRYLAREHGLVAEGSGAVPVAAILSGAVPVTGPCVAIVTGRNISFETLAGVLHPLR
jgi:threonine dehydratase